MKTRSKSRTYPRALLPVTIVLAMLPMCAISEEVEKMPVIATGDELIPGWKFELAVYGWLQSIDGTSGGNDMDLSFKEDILDMLEGAFMTSLYAEHGRWVGFGAYEYSKIKVDEDDVGGSVDIPIGDGPRGLRVSVPLNGDVEVSAPQHVFELGGGYKVHEGDNFDVILHAGTRYFDHEVTLRIDDLKAVLPPPIGDIDISRQKISEGDAWWQPFVGARFATSFAQNWRLRGRADYGYGSSGDSNEMWMAELIVDWRFKNWGAVELGYRYAEIDYDNGSSSDHYDWDMTERGPRVGFIFHF